MIREKRRWGLFRQRNAREDDTAKCRVHVDDEGPCPKEEAMEESLSDDSSVGQILLAMGAVTKERLLAAINEHKAASADRHLGALLIASGIVSHRQLNMALEAQTGLRSSSKRTQAHAKASIARESMENVVEITRAVRRKTHSCANKAARLHKKITGPEHPAVTEEMLVEQNAKA